MDPAGWELLLLPLLVSADIAAAAAPRLRPLGELSERLCGEFRVEGLTGENVKLSEDGLRCRSGEGSPFRLVRLLLSDLGGTPDKG